MQTRVRVLHAEVTPVTETAPLGAVGDGHLTLHGPLMEMSWDDFYCYFTRIRVASSSDSIRNYFDGTTSVHAYQVPEHAGKDRAFGAPFSSC